MASRPGLQGNRSKHLREHDLMAAAAVAVAVAVAATPFVPAPAPRRYLRPMGRAGSDPGRPEIRRLERRKPPRSALGVRLPGAAEDGGPEPGGVAEFVERSKELARPDGGPVRWFTPLECGSPAPGSPLLLYLPGIDGTGLGLIRHHKKLGKIFNVWCLHIPVMDRMPFEALVEYLERTVKLENSCLPGRPIYLVGESLGACLALATAARNPDFDFVLVLANPATSFGKSQLYSVLTLVDAVPEPLHTTTQFLFDFITGTSPSMASPYVENWPFLQEAVRGLSENFAYMLTYLSFLADSPMKSMLWKLKMLRSASLFVNSRLHAIKAQILILASGRDQLFPSHEEAERLCNALPNSRIRHFKDSGHIIFLEGGFDLVTTIKGAGYYRRSKQTDYVSDYLLPTPYEMKQAIDGYRWVEIAASPVMLSTLENGEIVKGLAGIPSKGPVVLVGYHMLMGFEIGPLVSHFLTEKKTLIRGIAHPFLFERASELIMPDSSSFDTFRIMGAVPVSASNFYKLLSTKSFVLLYPGGAREALHRKGEQYKLFWPEKSEFVRMASRFEASIVPFGVVGEDDICELLLDYDDLVNVPFYDVLDKRINQDAVRLRTDATGEVGKQELYLPGLLPKFPGRFYFLFGRPIETIGRKEELRDRKRAHQLYMHVKCEVENCISYLIKKREKDPYRNLLPRLLYQATRGVTTEVPTFEL